MARGGADRCVETPVEAVPYELYFLENQSPEHLAGILERIVPETASEPQGKVTAKAPGQPADRIVSVPDELTFSLIVYASRKDQDWIRALIDRLDHRQAQVLIDVTLVPRHRRPAAGQG